MNLYRETGQFGLWFVRIIASFIRVRPVATIAVIIAASISRVTSLLLFFLPLKVILLAASDGVPVYFRAFIAQETKEQWIIGLAAGAIVLYVFNMLLDTASKRLAAAASQQVTRNANEIRILGNEEKTASSYYERVCAFAAAGLFVLIGVFGGLLIYSELFGLVIALFIASALFSGWVLAGSDDINPGRLKRFARDRLGSYLKIFTAVIFLSSFLFLLYPYLRGGQQNLLIAILSILIIRQVLSAVEASVREAVRLHGERHRVDALVLKQAHLERTDARRERPVRIIFGKSARRRVARDALAEQGVEPDSVEALWEDSQFAGISTMHITGRHVQSGVEQHYQLQAFPADQLHRLENENFLRTKVPADRLKLPRTVSRFTAGPFECRLLEYGTGRGLDPDSWPEWQRWLTAHLWCCQPPRGLVEAFAGSRPLLQRQLHPGSVTRLEVAVDSDAEAETLQWFRGGLDALRHRLATIPLYLHNPEITRHTTVRSGQDDIRIMNWGRWTLLPVGAIRPPTIKDEMIPGILARLQEERDDLPEGFGETDLAFAGRCYALQQNIARGQLKASLDLVASIREEWRV